MITVSEKQVSKTSIFELPRVKNCISMLCTNPLGGTPKGTLSYCTCAQEAVSTKRRKKFGSSVAYKTVGTFLSKSETRRCQWVGH